MVVYMADNYSKGQMIGLGIAFLILPIVAVGFRLWAKLLGRRTVQLDDYLVIVALLFAIGCCALQLVAAIDGALGQHETVDANGQPVLTDIKFIIYEKCKFAVNMISTVGLGFTKASILVFYIGIFRGKTFIIIAQTLIGIVAIWTVSFFFANLFTCYPITPFVEPFYGHKCIDAINMWYSMSVSDLVVDILILLLPIPLVLQLQLRPKQKIGVLAMFLLGATVCAFSTARLVAYYHVGDGFAAHYADETYYTSPVFFWASIELSSAIFSACLPTYRPIWLHLTNKPLHTEKSVQLTSYAANSGSRWGESKGRNRLLRTDNDSYLDLEDGAKTQVNTNIDGGAVGDTPPTTHGGIAVERSVETSYR